MRQFYGAALALGLVACGGSEPPAPLSSKASPQPALAAPAPAASPFSAAAPAADLTEAAYIRRAEALDDGLTALSTLQAASEAKASTGVADAATEQQVQSVAQALGSSAVTNGQLTAAVRHALQALDWQAALATSRTSATPNPAAALRQRLAPSLQRFNASSSAALLPQFVSVEYVTVSGGITRTQRGLVNVPTWLDVDDRFGPDVIATVSLAPALQGGVDATLRVSRTLQGVPGLGGLLSRPLPLDLRARTVLPVSNMTGQDDPTLRLDVGFISATDLAGRTEVQLNLNPGLRPGASPAATVDWTTSSPRGDLTLAVDALQLSAATGTFEKKLGFTLTNTPVLGNVQFALTLDDLIRLSARTSADAQSTLGLDVPGTLNGTVQFNALPCTLSFELGDDGQGLLLRYTAASAIERASAAVQLAGGPALDMQLSRIPAALNGRITNPDATNGRRLSVDFGGDSLGEIALTLVNNAVPRPVPPQQNGLVFDNRQGFSLGARLEGFTALSATLAQALELSTQIRTAKPFVVDVDLVGGGQLDASASNLPERFTARLEAAPGFRAQFQGSEIVQQLQLAARFNGAVIDTSIRTLPLALELCLQSGSNGCTGETAGTVIDSLVTGSSPFRLTLNACLSNCDGVGPASLLGPFRIDPLVAQTLGLSIHVEDAERRRVTIPFGKGEFWLSSAGQRVEFNKAAQLGPGGITFDFLGTINNRRIRYDLGPVIPSIDRTGSIDCERFSLEVRVGNANLGNLIDGGLRRLVCG